MFPLSLMILVIFIFSLFFLRLAKGLSILLIFSKNQLFISLILPIVSLCSILFIPNLYYFLLSYGFRFILFFFS